MLFQVDLEQSRTRAAMHCANQLETTR